MLCIITEDLKKKIKIQLKSPRFALGNVATCWLALHIASWSCHNVPLDVFSISIRVDNRTQSHSVCKVHVQVLEKKKALIQLLFLSRRGYRPPFGVSATHQESPTERGRKKESKKSRYEGPSRINSTKAKLFEKINIIIKYIQITNRVFIMAIQRDCALRWLFFFFFFISPYLVTVFHF